MPIPAREKRKHYKALSFHWYFFSVSVGFGAFYGPTFSAFGAFQVFIFFRSGW